MLLCSLLALCLCRCCVQVEKIEISTLRFWIYKPPHMNTIIIINCVYESCLFISTQILHTTQTCNITFSGDFINFMYDLQTLCYGQHVYLSNHHTSSSVSLYSLRVQFHTWMLWCCCWIVDGTHRCTKFVHLLHVRYVQRNTTCSSNVHSIAEPWFVCLLVYLHWAVRVTIHLKFICITPHHSTPLFIYAPVMEIKFHTISPSCLWKDVVLLYDAYR